MQMRNAWELSSDVFARSRIGTELACTTDGGVCLLEAMYHSLPDHKKAAFCATDDHLKTTERWKVARDVIPPEHQNSGFTAEGIGQYLEFLKVRSLSS